MKYILPTLAIACSLINTTPGADAGERTNMRGERYGEILLGKGGLLIPSEFDVYNTIGLNDCPEELWSKLDPEKIKKETGVKAVKLNGPRYWVIDGLTGSTLVSKVQRNFGGIEMRHAGTLELSIKDKLSLGKAYATHKVARKTIWVFKAGRPVYQLINPDGEVYFMQSFSVQKEKQKLDSLEQLGSKLKLPEGWKFRTLNLKKDFELKAINGIAYVLQDNLENTYQKSSAKISDDL
ncbi:MAG: hypothetical protein K2X27_13635 [Candidatus Obscuribacterales bacterium]|nr:hypothetical protein [Candidatus Obscuribacterales bacterium]